MIGFKSFQIDFNHMYHAFGGFSERDIANITAIRSAFVLSLYHNMASSTAAEAVMVQLRMRGGLTADQVRQVAVNMGWQLDAKTISGSLGRSVVWWSPDKTKKPKLFLTEEAEMYRLATNGPLKINKFSGRLKTFWLQCQNRLLHPTTGRFTHTSPTEIALKETLSQTDYLRNGPIEVTDSLDMTSIKRTRGATLLSGNVVLIHQKFEEISHSQRQALKAKWMAFLQ